jgi:hypothetical protein
MQILGPHIYNRHSYMHHLKPSILLLRFIPSIPKYIQVQNHNLSINRRPRPLHPSPHMIPIRQMCRPNLKPSLTNPIPLLTKCLNPLTIYSPIIRSPHRIAKQQQPLDLPPRLLIRKCHAYPRHHRALTVPAQDKS